MEKKVYMSPLFEVAKVNMSGVVLAGSPDSTPVPPPGPAGVPQLTAPIVLGNDSVPVF